MVPSSCRSKELGLAAASSAATGARPSHNIESFEKVQAVTRTFPIFLPQDQKEWTRWAVTPWRSPSPGILWRLGGRDIQINFDLSLDEEACSSEYNRSDRGTLLLACAFCRRDLRVASRK